MWPVSKKEIQQFFSSLTGIVTLSVFLLMNGLFLFVFPDTSIFDFGYATLDKFFELAPLLLLFLVPATTMRSFSEEFKTGTYEILQTKPLSHTQLILGKYLGSLIILTLALLPTIVYAISLQQLSISNMGIDKGAIIGCYLGLFCLAAVFAAIGICCSSFTQNPVVAFIVCAFACFILYNGCSAISRIPALAGGADYYIEMLGIDYHYKSMSRGVVDSRDVIYFTTTIFFFLFITQQNLLKRVP
jgi:ABC-2 type transport system permease protein